MREQSTREIDGFEYTATQLGFTDARRILTLLTKKGLPGFVLGLAGAVKGVQGGGVQSLLDVDFTEIAEGALRLIQDLEEEDIVTLETAFGKACTVRLDTGNPYLTSSTVAVHFRGRLLSYFKWLAFCVEVNYTDFFDVFRGLVGPAQSPSAA